MRRELERQKSKARPGDLTRREIEVLRRVAEGLSTTEIATRLFISPKTVDHHIQNVYAKIYVSNRVAATRWAFDHGVMADLVS